MTTTPLAPVDLPLLIVGGGIGGLATALASANAGRPAHLIEQAPAFAEIGAGLQIGPNATRMMDRLGILDDVEKVAVHPKQAVLRDAITGERLTALTLGEQFRQHYGYPYLVMHRSDLLQILLDACLTHPLITLENNRRAAEIRPGRDLVTVTCEDGTEYRTQVLIGADGLRSRVRRLFSDDEPICSGYVAYRGTMPIEDVVTNIDDNDVVLWVGPGLHLMQYPVRRGELYNQVAVFLSPTFANSATEWGTPEELDTAFAATVEPARIGATAVSRARHWPLYDREPLDRYVKGRVALIGDAAHPMLQVLGQGACQALEDALCLADALTAHPTEVEKALVAYEDARLSRTTKCQRTARPWAEIWHLTDPLSVALRNRIFRARANNDYSEVDWLYAWTPPLPATSSTANLLEQS